MSQKWNLQDIRPAESRKKRTAKEPAETKARQAAIISQKDEVPQSTETTTKTNRKSKSLIYTAVISLGVVGLGIFASMLLGGAELTTHPKHREPNVNAVFEAVSVQTSDNDLLYEVMTLDAEGERQVSATGQEQVTSQARGTISIYNNHSKDSLRLVTNTRFESEGGLIFKIKDPAIVPGYSTDENGKKNPGVVTAEVYADEVGEQYNLAPSRFTVPGFAGEVEFDNIYAESETTFSEGFDGLKFIIDQAELETAQQALRAELRNSLLARIDSEKPAGFVQFDGAVTFIYESLPAIEYGDNLATIKEKVYMQIPLFKDEQFASYIAQATVPGYEDRPVRIDDFEVLTFEYANATTSSSDITELDSLSFKLSGRPMIVWTYDENQLKTDLLNKNRTALTAVLGAYPAIEDAKAVIRPFWKKKFPASLDGITIIEEIEIK